MDPTINHLNQLVQRIEDLSEELEICDDIIATLFEDLYSEFLQLSESTDMKDNKTKAGKKMPEKELEKAAKGKGKKSERANLAMKLKKYSKHKKDLKEATELAAEHEYLSGMLNQKDIQPQKAEAIKARLKQIENQVAPQSGGMYTKTISGEY